MGDLGLARHEHTVFVFLRQGWRDRLRCQQVRGRRVGRKEEEEFEKGDVGISALGLGVAATAAAGLVSGAGPGGVAGSGAGGAGVGGGVDGELDVLGLLDPSRSFRASLRG
jgi:hypothetical protein